MDRELKERFKDSLHASGVVQWVCILAIVLSYHMGWDDASAVSLITMFFALPVFIACDVLWHFYRRLFD